MATRPRKALHLWEAKHPYYAQEGNYYSNECHITFGTWAEFIAAEGDADMDLNLIYRWDWQRPEDDNGKKLRLNPDPYYRDMTLKLFYIGQRKALARSVNVSVCQADEPAVRKWLTPRLSRLLKLWAPLAAPPVPEER